MNRREVAERGWSCCRSGWSAAYWPSCYRFLPKRKCLRHVGCSTSGSTLDVTVDGASQGDSLTITTSGGDFAVALDGNAACTPGTYPYDPSRPCRPRRSLTISPSAQHAPGCDEHGMADGDRSFVGPAERRSGGTAPLGRRLECATPLWPPR